MTNKQLIDKQMRRCGSAYYEINELVSLLRKDKRYVRGSIASNSQVETLERALSIVGTQLTLIALDLADQQETWR